MGRFHFKISYKSREGFIIWCSKDKYSIKKNQEVSKWWESTVEVVAESLEIEYFGENCFWKLERWLV